MTVPLAAVIVDWPVAGVLARPLDPAALLIVIAAVFEELQVTWVVRFWVELSV